MWTTKYNIYRFNSYYYCSIKINGKTTLFNYESSNQYDYLRKIGMRPKTIKAMSGDIIDVIPPEIMQILKYYSLEIANEIQSDWKIFSDSDPNISY